MVYLNGLSSVGNSQNFLGNLLATGLEDNFAANVLRSIFGSEADLIHFICMLSNVFYIFGEYISIFCMTDRNRTSSINATFRFVWIYLIASSGVIL
jgi:hypothetical protein